MELKALSLIVPFPPFYTGKKKKLLSFRSRILYFENTKPKELNLEA